MRRVAVTFPGVWPWGGDRHTTWGRFGGDLLSHPVARAVPSALTGLASGFGMEPGVSPSLWPPKLYGDVTGPPCRCPGPWSGRVGLGMFGSYLGNRIVDANASVTHQRGCV